MTAVSSKQLMRMRMECKQTENQGKPPLCSSDVVQTNDFVFSKPFNHEGDSGNLLLAKRKSNRDEQYLVKHAYTDCACNEFVYTKLAQAMGYPMPDAVLFQLSANEKRSYFTTEYIIGERYLNVVKAYPTYEEIRDHAENRAHYFAFHALYGMTGESDGIELLLADDGLIYRVDTTDTFPVSNYYLDLAAINIELNGINPHEYFKKQMLSYDFSKALDSFWCDMQLETCLKLDADCLPYFLEPFERIQAIKSDYIDDFLNTLCYFYPDFLGEFFKRYISALQSQSAEYLKDKR